MQNWPVCSRGGVEINLKEVERPNKFALKSCIDSEWPSKEYLYITGVFVALTPVPPEVCGEVCLLCKSVKTETTSTLGQRL